jgi:hypothetical protein
MYCEDMDWCLRARNAGWGVVYVPDAVFTHAIGKSSNHAAEKMIVAHHRSMWRFYKKHQAFSTSRSRLPCALWCRSGSGCGSRSYRASALYQSFAEPASREQAKHTIGAECPTGQQQHGVAAPTAFDVSPLSFSGIVADYGLIGAVGIGALLLAVVLAPLIGGYPPGAAYGADTSLNALRALICVAGLCRPRLISGNTGSGKTPSLLPALFGLTGALTVLSLLVHSQFLTSSVLLFALLPATLDWLCYALLTILAWQLARQDKRIALLLVGALTIGAAITAVAVARSYGDAVQTGMRGFRASGTFFSPNFAGGFLGLCLPVLAAALPCRAGAARRSCSGSGHRACVRRTGRDRFPRGYRDHGAWADCRDWACAPLASERAAWSAVGAGRRTGRGSRGARVRVSRTADRTRGGKRRGQ